MVLSWKELTLDTPGRMVACLLCHRELVPQKELHGIASVDPALVSFSVFLQDEEVGISESKKQSTESTWNRQS